MKDQVPKQGSQGPTPEDLDLAANVAGGRDEGPKSVRRGSFKPIAWVIGAIGLLALGGYGISRYLDSMPNLKKDAVSAESIPTGFMLGLLPASESIEQIRVTILPAPGREIDELVDVHLGFGFPLRLSTVDAQEMQPVFAALPTESSLDADAEAIPAGELSWFQFDQTAEANERDPLKTSQTLLQGLKVSDITQIGFATKGQSDWTLAG